MFIGTWWALIPPLLAIILAFITKEVYSSLFIGVAVGALLYSGFHPWDSFVNFFEIMKNSMNLNILIFDVLLGMIIVLMAKSGGSAAYGKWAGTKIRTKRSALLATMGLGVLIFVDDYFNCLTVGSVMRPVTDQQKVSRAKLAYIIDATAAPVTPIFGNPRSPKIIIGSRAIFRIAPIATDTIDTFVNPSAVTNAFIPNVSCTNNVPSAYMFK